MGLLLAGCISDGPDPMIDAGPPDGAGPCGPAPTTLTLGVGHPMEPVPDLRFQIGQGLQGGHHFDISVRVSGPMDPDSVDVQLDLFHGETRIAQHLTDDWLLHIYPEGPWCEYPRARLVLVDEEGGLLDADAVEALVGETLQLDVHLRSAGGDADGSFQIIATGIDRLR
ncbi:MAG: hypothetical protein KC620_19420 [Myxococcales bacterium]|nr:hypothetical protein [Myxococcales bacterium]